MDVGRPFFQPWETAFTEAVGCAFTALPLRGIIHAEPENGGALKPSPNVLRNNSRRGGAASELFESTGANRHRILTLATASPHPSPAGRGGTREPVVEGMSGGPPTRERDSRHGLLGIAITVYASRSRYQSRVAENSRL